MREKTKECIQLQNKLEAQADGNNARSVVILACIYACLQPPYIMVYLFQNQRVDIGQ